MPNHQIDQIFETLESAGFPRHLQSGLLPDWVTPEVLSDTATSSEIAAILAKRLGLRVSPLLTENPSVESLRQRNVKYKRSIPNKAKSLTSATSIAVSVAESVAFACQLEFTPFPKNACDFRTEVFNAFGGKWLGLKNLLMACWSHGVPVVYLANLGKGIAKMDGMVVYTGDRPVIILSKASPLWAWQLFILAHEVAHILLGHVTPGEVLIDENLSEISYVMMDVDLDERNADMFAIELLNGRKQAVYDVSDPQVNFKELAYAALEFGERQRIDPGHIVLNFATHSGKWDVGVAAAKALQDDNLPASKIISEAMWDSIIPEALPTDTIEFLEKVTG